MTKLRELRNRRNITQFELSKIIDLPPSRISEIEHGKRDLKITEAVKAAHFLGVSLDELAGIQKQKPATDDAVRVGQWNA